MNTFINNIFIVIFFLSTYRILRGNLVLFQEDTYKDSLLSIEMVIIQV